MKLKDVIIVSVSILLLNFSATLQCPSIGNCSSDANADTVASRLLRFEIASKARSSSRDSPTPTNTVDVSVSKKAVWNKRNKSPEFHGKKGGGGGELHRHVSCLSPRYAWAEYKTIAITHIQNYIYLAGKGGHCMMS